MKILRKLFSNLFLLNIILVICMIFLTNIISVNLFFIVIRPIFSLIFILFLPGFLLMKLLFKKIELPKLVALSVFLSVCISIMDALVLHLLNVTINFVNIMNFLCLIVLALSPLLYLREKVKK